MMGKYICQIWVNWLTMIAEGTECDTCAGVGEYNNMYIYDIIEPPRGKTNNVVSEQVRHKPTCTSTEKS